MRRQYDSTRLAQFVAGPSEKEKAESLLFQSINMDLPPMPMPKEKHAATRKKRPAGLKVASEHADIDNYTEKESLEEWMSNLQLRLDEACNTADSPSGSGPTSAMSSGTNSGVSTAFPFPDVSSRNEDGRSSDHQNRSSSKASKNEGKGRWKSAVNLSDTAVEFLTDGDYLGQLQGKIHKKSINILYERLADRKTKDQEEKPVSTRPKGDGLKSKSSKKKKESGASAFFDE